MAQETSEGFDENKKSHRQRKSGRKSEKKKQKNEHVQELTDKQRNPKAFAFNSAIQAERRFRRKKDLETKKQHIPVVDRTPLEPPPVMVAVVGPPKVGKTTLIQNVVKHWTRQPMTNLAGPVTIVTGKKQRMTIVECNNDINCMIDLAKVADLLILLVDASFGFEMEVFEFLNICQVHGMPRILGVLTHLDLLKNNKQLKKTKKTLKHRFWTEVYAGAKLFYLSGMLHGEYLRNEVKNLARFMSVIKFRPLVWRTTHPYVLVDRLEDITDPERLRQNPKADRDVCVYGYVRGVALNKENPVHIPGCGDTRIRDVALLPDPCPLPEAKKRSLLEKERLVYAPFSGVGGIVYDKDAVYVDLAGSHSHSTQITNEGANDMVQSILTTQDTIDAKRDKSELKFFSGSRPITSSEFQEASQCTAESSYGEELVEEDGRTRRRVVFHRDLEGSGAEESDGGEDDEEDEEEEEGDREASTTLRGVKKNADITSRIAETLEKFSGARRPEAESDSESGSEDGSYADDDDDDDDEEEEEPVPKKPRGDFEASATRWKDNLALKASQAFLDRQNTTQNLYKLVYGGYKRMLEGEQTAEQEGGPGEEIGGLFHMVSEKQKLKMLQKDTQDGLDTTVFPADNLRDWSSPELRDVIKDCFVTGKWKKSEDAEELLRLDDLEEDMEGDFEDLETGEKSVTAAKGEPTAGEEGVVPGDLMERKRKLKAKFDAEYDDQEEYSHYNDLKMQADRQAQLNRSEMEDLPDDLRVAVEGYRPGSYVRVELSRMPCELVDHFDPTYPLIVGGLQPMEENIGYIQLRFKKHRWFNKILKTKDPLVLSLGWRRFQTIPVFSKLEDNMRSRMLKYTPQHVSCMVHCYGPITPQGTGCLAIQDMARVTPGFRIAATGSVVEVDKSTTVLKKLKLVGTPMKIYKKTAYIQGMFNSALEVGKFEGAKIRTVSGIRGMIKKAASKPEGVFRATFEDKIKLSDLVFCRTWYQVEVPKLYNPVTSLLLEKEAKNQWMGMKSVGQLKREQNIRSEAQQDSMYTPIIRKPKVFAPLNVPKSLQKNLPYKDKPKQEARKKRSVQDGRIAVVREPYEAKVANMMKVIRKNYEHKKESERQAMVARVTKHKKVLEMEESRKMRRQKEVKRQVFRALSKMEKKKSR